MVPYILMPRRRRSRRAARWARCDAAAAGTGPFQITRSCRASPVTLARNDATGPQQEGQGRPDPAAAHSEANTRLAALPLGRVDWIEVRRRRIPSLKQAGFVISTGSYPHVWPWFYNMAAKNSPVADVRVRQALNYCIDRAPSSRC